MINLKDANGQWVCIKEGDLIKHLCEAEFVLLGYKMDELIDLTSAYEASNGKRPLSTESIKKTFNLT